MADSIRNGFLIAMVACALATPGMAQNESGGGAKVDQGAAGADNLDQRLKRQHFRINHALKSGLIKDDQAKNLRDAVDDVAGDLQELRQKNGGNLKPEDIKQIENSLNQTSEQIKSLAESGKKSVQSGNVLGATWTKGPDGAQNPKQLLQQMKQENKRELRQERQNTEQKIEQQQMQYEKEMVEQLGEQKQDIMKQKEDVKEIRKESGAD